MTKLTKNILLLIVLFNIVACGGGSSTDEPKPTSNTIPTITSIEINGLPIVGETLTGSYQYYDAEGDVEGDSIYQWYANKEPINGENNIGLLLTSSLLNKSVTFGVMPVAISGVLAGNESTSLSVVIGQELDYTLRTSCAQYSEITGHNGGEFLLPGFGSIDYPDKMEVFLVDDAGIKLANIFTKLGNPLSTYAPLSGDNETHFAIGFPRNSIDEQVVTLIKENLDKNLLIECTYEDGNKVIAQKYSLFQPLNQSSVWEKAFPYYNDQNITNNSFFEVSVISDLYYKIYLASYAHSGNKEASINNAEAFMLKNFPSTVFKNSKWSEYGGWGIYRLRNPGTEQASRYMQLGWIASSLTIGDIEQTNNVIKAQYFEYMQSSNCLYSIICAGLFPERQELLTLNNKFSDKLSNWIEYKSDNSTSIGGITNPIIQTEPSIEHTLVLELKSTHPGSENAASREVFQKYAVDDPNDLENLFLTISNRELVGTCEAFFGCSASGLAGYYICFADAQTINLGCAFVGTHYDSNTLPILSGLVFDFDSSQDFYYRKIPKEKSFLLLDIKEILVNHLPNANNNIGNIKSVYYGAFAGEAVNTYYGTCTACESKVDVNEISLIRNL